MAKPELGKTYLVVFCKNCHKGFRVRPEPLYQGQKVDVREPETHTCRSCGFRAEYKPNEMRVATVSETPDGR